jgi:hypothetical protein
MAVLCAECYQVVLAATVAVRGDDLHAVRQFHSNSRFHTEFGSRQYGPMVPYMDLQGQRVRWIPTIELAGCHRDSRYHGEAPPLSPRHRQVLAVQ